MKKEEPLILRDSKKIKNILIQVNLENNTSTVISNFTAWENIALILEALGTTVQKCIKEGIDKDRVYNAINNYFKKVLPAYTIKQKATSDTTN